MSRISVCRRLHRLRRGAGAFPPQPTALNNMCTGSLRATVACEPVPPPAHCFVTSRSSRPQSVSPGAARPRRSSLRPPRRSCSTSHTCRYEFHRVSHRAQQPPPLVRATVGFHRNPTARQVLKVRASPQKPSDQERERRCEARTHQTAVRSSF